MCESTLWLDSIHEQRQNIMPAYVHFNLATRAETKECVHILNRSLPPNRRLTVRWSTNIAVSASSRRNKVCRLALLSAPSKAGLPSTTPTLQIREQRSRLPSFFLSPLPLGRRITSRSSVIDRQSLDLARHKTYLQWVAVCTLIWLISHTVWQSVTQGLKSVIRCGNRSHRG